MFYLLGDIHGNSTEIRRFIKKAELTSNDVIILLGDAGLNYYLDKRDKKIKQELQEMGLTFFVIRGNHEQRPSIIAEEHPDEWVIEERFGNSIYIEKAYPNILYALDIPAAYTFDITNRSEPIKAWVVPGAYSVDKYYRLEKGWKWFPQEQLSKKEMEQGLEDLKKQDKIDIVLSHTCPHSLIPTELFLSCINQSSVDNTMENYLNRIYNFFFLRTEYVPRLWVWGHYHALKIYPEDCAGLRPIMLYDNAALCLDDYFLEYKYYNAIIIWRKDGE